MNGKLVTAVVFAALSGSAWCAIVGTTPDSGSHDLYNEWSYVDGDMTKYVWEDHLQPTAENDYLVTNSVATGGILTDREDGVKLLTFPGNSLTVSQGAWLLVQSVHYGSTWLDFPGGLEFDGKTVFRYWGTASENRTVSITGQHLKLSNTDSGEVNLQFQSTAKSSGVTTTFAIYAPLVGSGQFIRLTKYSSTYQGCVALDLHGDCSQYTGTIYVNSRNHGVSICGQNFSGRIVMPASGGFLKVYGGDTTVGTVYATVAEQYLTIDGVKLTVPTRFTLKDQDTITFSGSPLDGIYGGFLDITASTVAVPGALKVRATADMFFADNAETGITLIRVPKSKLSLKNVNLTCELLPSSRAPGLYRPDVTFEVTEDDTYSYLTARADKRLVELYPSDLPVVYHLSTDNSANGGSSLAGNRPDKWSDEKDPHGEASYLIYAGQQLMTHGNCTVFPGNVLRFQDYATTKSVPQLALCSSPFYVTNLVVESGLLVNSYTGAAVLQGNLFFPKWSGTDDGICKVFLNSGEIRFESTIRGDSDLKVTTKNADTTPANHDVFSLTGDNRAFMGGILVTCTNPDWETFGGSIVTLKTQDEKSLGGAMASFRADGLKLERGSALVLTDNADFAEPTRGFTVSERGVVSVAEGKRAVFRQPCTWNGRLIKNNAGVLALGGDVKFTLERLEQPTEGSNLLDITDGWLAAASKTGCDGLKVLFVGTDVGIRLASGATGDVRDYGLYNVKETVAPFDIAAPSTAILVQVDGPKLERDVDLAVVTVATSDLAEAVKGKLRFRKTDESRGFRCAFTTRENADGSVTIVAELKRTGILVIVR